MLQVLRMSGRCRSGHDTGGTRWHAVRSVGVREGQALCGARPGPKGNGWSDETSERVTCPRCFAKIAGLAMTDARRAPLLGTTVDELRATRHESHDDAHLHSSCPLCVRHLRGGR